MLEAELAGGAEGGDGGGVFGTGAALIFLTAAGEERVEGGAAVDVEDADAFGGVEFVTGEGE